MPIWQTNCNITTSRDIVFGGTYSNIKRLGSILQNERIDSAYEKKRNK